MTGHIHLSVLTVIEIAAVVVLTTFFLNMAALHFGSSDNPDTRLWGAAFANLV